ncbi:MAG: ABC transporter substrate-binding protein [Deltaproteobacteria bacterium]|nr:ABC transporter substrate-binding protein [Deltaproteobacteria bacterium]
MRPFCQIFFVALGVFFFGFLPQGTSAPIKLRIGYSTFAAADSGLWVAKDLGTFEKNGLDVELIFIRSSSIGVPALVSGSTPITIMGGTAAIRSNLAGSDLVLLGSFKKLPSLAFLVANKKIARIEDLKGKTVGVGRFGGATDYVTRLALKKLGIDPEREVKIRQIGNTPERTVALQTGAIDATVLSPENKFAAERFGINVLLDLRKLGVEILNTDIISTRGFIQKNEETIHRFMRAMVEGIHLFKTNKKKSILVMSQYMRTGDSKILEVGYDYEAEVYERAPYPSIAGIQLALEEIAQENPAARKADVRRFFDARWVQELDKSGFIDALYR